MKPRTLITTANRFGKMLCCASLLLIAGVHAAAAAEIVPSPPWIQIDTKTLTLTVYSSENQALERVRNISIGSGGTTNMRRAGDSTTPLGTFHVAWINHRSPFHIFFGFNYPTVSYAERAYQLGIIGKSDYESILDASRNGAVPPQGTPLGGRIGIHGLGHGNPNVQRRINWTDGCIALSNADVERLAKWIRIGTRVEIR